MISEGEKKSFEDFQQKAFSFKVPELYVEPLYQWVYHAVKPGTFLESILRNDLMGTMGKSDPKNRQFVFDICRFLINEAPYMCFGDDEHFEAWKDLKSRKEGGKR